MWGLLNETPDGPVFRHAVAVLPLVRALDDTPDGDAQQRPLGRARRPAAWPGLESGATPAARTRGSRSIGTKHADHGAWGSPGRPGQLAFHPGRDGEYSVVRWTAPADGRSTSSADVHRASPSGRRPTSTCCTTASRCSTASSTSRARATRRSSSKTIAVAAGDTLDFVVRLGQRQLRRRHDGAGRRPSSRPTARPTTRPPISRPRRIPTARGATASCARARRPKPDDLRAFTPRRLRPRAGRQPEQSRLDGLGGRARATSTRTSACRTRPTSSARCARSTATASRVFLSEYGIGSAVDLLRAVRHFEQLGQDRGRRRPVLSRRARPLPGRLAAVEAGRDVRRPEDFFAAEPRRRWPASGCWASTPSAPTRTSSATA